MSVFKGKLQQYRLKQKFSLEKKYLVNFGNFFIFSTFKHWTYETCSDHTETAALMLQSFISRARGNSFIINHQLKKNQPGTDGTCRQSLVWIQLLRAVKTKACFWSGRDLCSVRFVDFYLVYLLKLLCAWSLLLCDNRPTLPVNFADMRHLNWSGMFLLVTTQHQWPYEHIPLHQWCYKWISIKSLNLPDKYISFLLRKVWLAKTVCCLFSHVEIVTALRHSVFKGDKRSWFDWPRLKSAAITPTHAHASYFSAAPCAWFPKLPKKIWPHLLAASSAATPTLRLIQGKDPLRTVHVHTKCEGNPEHGGGSTDSLTWSHC